MGVVRQQGAEYEYTDYRLIPPQKAFDVAAAPEGGMEAFISHFSYPDWLREKHVGGIVIALVSLDASGRVLSVQIVRSVYPFLDRMVREAILRTKWTPALKNKNPTPAKFYLPVQFNKP
ncbi:MAG TPA: energy transducer TonB [Chthoniobacterales bacterium]|jgi:TonB family protein